MTFPSPPLPTGTARDGCVAHTQPYREHVPFPGQHQHPPLPQQEAVQVNNPPPTLHPAEGVLSSFCFIIPEDPPANPPPTSIFRRRGSLVKLN